MVGGGIWSMTNYFIRGNTLARDSSKKKPADGDFFEVFAGNDDAVIAFNDYLTDLQNERPAVLIIDIFAFNQV